VEPWAWALEVGVMVFLNRADAGGRLAQRLKRFQAEDPVVVALPRGGVPVAAEVAAALHAPLDVLVVRKLGCPWQPELGVGAIGEGGVILLNHELIGQAGLTRREIEAVAEREHAELERRVRRYRGDRPPVPVAGRTALLVDDGLATGFTARAAIQVLRARGARRVVLAVPVAPPSAVRELRMMADDVVAMETPEPFIAIGRYYADFAQTTDEEVSRLLAAPGAPVTATVADDPVRACEIDLGRVRLAADLAVPAHATGTVVFAHGSGSSRLSPRNRFVARVLNQNRLATLLVDLLTPGEELVRANVFDVQLLADRLVAITGWLRDQPEVTSLPVGYFGASTGAAAALWAAADPGLAIGAVVSRGGRPDLAEARLAAVRAPTLLIVGGHDQVVLELNRQARARLRCASALEVVPGATHLFQEPGALERVAALAEAWFTLHLPPEPANAAARPGEREAEP
jgi:putative phosphoribosyl transferase